MKISITSTALTATLVRMPAPIQGSETGASLAGRRIVDGTTVSAYRTRVPAFVKDAFKGVRAWSPPV